MWGSPSSAAHPTKNLCRGPKEVCPFQKSPHPRTEHSCRVHRPDARVGVVCGSSDPVDIKTKQILEANSFVEEFMRLENIRCFPQDIPCFPANRNVRYTPIYSHETHLQFLTFTFIRSWHHRAPPGTNLKSSGTNSKCKNASPTRSTQRSPCTLWSAAGFKVFGRPWISWHQGSGRRTEPIAADTPLQAPATI